MQVLVIACLIGIANVEDLSGKITECAAFDDRDSSIARD
jgi:hypothetical protein